MKRSEMIKFIQIELEEIVKDYMHKPPNRRAGKFFSSKAAGILDLLEGLGMRPPEHITMPTTYNRGEGGYGFAVNEWEPE